MSLSFFVAGADYLNGSQRDMIVGLRAGCRPLPPELSNLAPTNRSTGSNGSGGLSALPRDSARRFSRRSGGSGEGTGISIDEPNPLPNR